MFKWPPSNYFAATVLATNPGGSKAEKLFDSVRDLMHKLPTSL
jgi:hypothetical protein